MSESKELMKPADSASSPPPVERILPEHEQVRTYAYQGATDQEIATCLDCDVRELAIVYAGELARGRAERRMALRRMQWDHAEKGGASLLVLLGKCELGQGEEPALSQDRIIVRRLVDRTPKPSPV